MASGTAPQITCRALPGAIRTADGAHLEGLCAALRKGVRTRPEALALVVIDLRPDHVSAHLEWRTEDGLQTGPTVDFGFLDTGLGLERYRFIINGLLQATNLR